MQFDHLAVVLPADAVEAIKNRLGRIVKVRAITPGRHADDPYSHRPVDRSSACGPCLPGDALLILPRLRRCVDDGLAPAHRHARAAFAVTPTGHHKTNHRPPTILSTCRLSVRSRMRSSSVMYSSSDMASHRSCCSRARRMRSMSYLGPSPSCE